MCLVAGGLYLFIMMKSVNLDWSTSRILFLKKVHGWFGYFIVLAIQLVVFTGLLRKADMDNWQNSFRNKLILLNLLVWLIALVYGEIKYRNRLNTGVEFKTIFDLKRSMNRSEFDGAIKRGQKFVILDNLVIDVREYISQHPGGRFVLNHNVGRDISKFFFGGYSLENNDQKGTQGHNHSVFAKMIVNDLAVAVFESDIPVTTEKVMQNKAKAAEVNGETKTIYL